MQQVRILRQSALFALCAHEHVERLHLGPRGPRFVVVEQLLRNQDSASGRQPLVNAREQSEDFGFGPVVQNAPQAEQVGCGQRILEKVTSFKADAVGHLGRADDFSARAKGLGQVIAKRVAVKFG